MCNSSTNIFPCPCTQFILVQIVQCTDLKWPACVSTSLQWWHIRLHNFLDPYVLTNYTYLYRHNQKRCLFLFFHRNVLPVFSEYKQNFWVNNDPVITEAFYESSFLRPSSKYPSRSHTSTSILYIYYIYTIYILYMWYIYKIYTIYTIYTIYIIYKHILSL